MADNDISKRYAVNISLDVNSSNLDKLSNVDDILSSLDAPNTSVSSQENNRVTNVDVNTSNIESKLEKIISIISSKNTQSKEPINEAVVKAISDSFKSSLLDIIKHVNSVFSLKPAREVDAKAKEVKREPSKNNSDNNTGTQGSSLKSDMLPGEGAKNAIQIVPGSTANTALMQSGLMKKISNTSGLDVGVVRNSTAVSDGANATTLHSKKPSIHTRRGLSRIEEYAALPHEYMHVFQQNRMFNTGNFLSNVFGGGGSFGNDVIKKANEFVTNMIAAVHAALDKNLDSSDFDAVKNIYIKSIKAGSGISNDTTKKAISSIDYLRGLNISPESIGGIIGRDIQGISSKNGTELERAIANSGRKDISVKDGYIYIGKGKGKREATSVDDIYRIGLKNSDGHAIDRSVIASHFIARGLIGGLGSISVPHGGKYSTIAMLGYGKTRRQAADEFSAQSSFGIPFLPKEELRRRFEARNSIASIEQIKSILSSSAGTVYRNGGGVEKPSAKRYDNFRFGLNRFQSLAYALGGDNTLKIAESNGLSSASNNAEALQIIRLAHLFKGDASAEQKYISGLNKSQKKNYNELVTFFEEHANSYLNQDELSPVTFSGFRNNRENQQLGNAIYTMRGLSSGVRTGRIPSYYIRDTKYAKAGKSRRYGAGEKSLEEEVNGAGGNITVKETVGELDDALSEESFDTKEISEIKNRFLLAKDELDSLRERIESRKQISSRDMKLIGLGGTGTETGITKRSLGAEDRKAALKRIDEMLVSITEKTKSELEAARSRLGDDYQDYDINIEERLDETIRRIINNYKHANNKPILSDKEIATLVESINNQLIRYNEGLIGEAEKSGMNIDVLGTKFSPREFRGFRSAALKMFGNYLDKHGGKFTSDMSVLSNPDDKRMKGMNINEMLKFLDEEMVKMQDALSKINNTKEYDILEKKFNELLEMRKKFYLQRLKLIHIQKSCLELFLQEMVKMV